MSKVDWETAPEDAQFYSFSRLRKQDSGQEFWWNGRMSIWFRSTFDSVQWHRNQDDFEMRPVITVYKGQMTADQLCNTKIRIESVEHGSAFIDMVGSVFDADLIGTNLANRPFYFCGVDGHLSHQFNNFNYFNNHLYTEIKWQPAVSDEPTPEEAKAERWNGEGFPPSGIICKYNDGFGEAYECQTLGMYGDRMVCILIGRSGSAPDRIRFGTSSMFYPKPPQKEVWCKEVLSTLQLDDKTTPEDIVGMMYQRFQQGDIKPPEEEA